MRAPAEERHHDERRVASQKKVYQQVLMHPVDLSEQAPDPVTLYGGFGAATWGKSNLQRHVVPRGGSWDHTVQQPDASDGLGAYVVAPAVEERADEPSPLQPVRARKRVAPAGGLGIGMPRHGIHYRGLPELLLLTDRSLRPFLRRFLMIFLPPFDFMRLRKPCLFFFLRRLGW